MLDRPAPITAARTAAPPAVPWRAPLLALAAALAAWGALFATEVAAAISVWDSSTAYNHCWLILPIALWLGWQRRARLDGLVPAPAWPVALLLPPLALGWLLAERLGVMEGRQLAALAMLLATVVLVLGLRFGRAFAAPLAYLVFLVPFGEFAVPMLQQVTARLIEFGLGLTDIPHFVDDIVIEIPAGTFLVAEACAGLRFLIAAIAFGALYALVMFRSPGRRLAVMALSVAVPVLANGLRGFGLVILGHYQGSAAAVEADHVLYGWVFFSIVLLLLILVGLPFRQDRLAIAAPMVQAPPAPPRPAIAFAAAALVAVAGAATAPAASRAIERGGADAPAVVAAALDPAAGCVAEAEGARLRCGSWVVTARLLVFPARANWSAVVAERRRLLRGRDVDLTFVIRAPDGAARWDARQSPGEDGLRAVATWLDGHPAGEGLRDRARQAWNALSGGSASPVVLGLELRTEGAPAVAGRGERALFEQVLAAQADDLVTRAREVSRRR